MSTSALFLLFGLDRGGNCASGFLYGSRKVQANGESGRVGSSDRLGGRRQGGQERSAAEPDGIFRAGSIPGNRRLSPKNPAM